MLTGTRTMCCLMTHVSGANICRKTFRKHLQNQLSNTVWQIRLHS